MFVIARMGNAARILSASATDPSMSSITVRSPSHPLFHDHGVHQPVGDSTSINGLDKPNVCAVKLTLDWRSRAVSGLHIARARIQPPPRPKIPIRPLRLGNFSNLTQKGLFQQYRSGTCIQRLSDSGLDTNDEPTLRLGSRLTAGLRAFECSGLSACFVPTCDAPLIARASASAALKTSRESPCSGPFSPSSTRCLGRRRQYEPALGDGLSPAAQILLDFAERI
jgi:hypothetical protein